MSDSPAATPTPDYAELAKFLLKPFLDHPEDLRIDVEFSPVRQKVLIRVAFGEEGRAFGRGGRNVDAIRTTIEGIAQAAGHTAHVEIFGSTPSHSSAPASSPTSHNPTSHNPTSHNPTANSKPVLKKKVVD
jgi:uncharacterized protein